MIKVEKPNHTIPDILTNSSTQSKRTRLLRAKKWQKSSSYKSPYQSNDVRKTLKGIYHDKCAYCEQQIILPKKNTNKQAANSLTVEHFRPKATYYWLAYSWDNLLPVCYACNHEKENHFDILGTAITEIRASEIDNIHELAVSYHIEEEPKFIHPEIDDLTHEFIFNKKGEISSNHSRCQYVIEKCDLPREALRIKRKAIIDAIKAEFQAIQSQEEFEKLFRKIKEDSQKPRKEFTALYRYILSNFQVIIMS